ncbi:Kynurenine 3-monooxygenase [Beauveria bassiana]|nr:Kynurenine 3-monooxygenase [Beauveria bassiana]
MPWRLFFNHKLIHVDFHSCTALVDDRIWLSQSIEAKLDIMLRADGAHSAVRYHMMKTSRMDYQHECFDVLWCELRMKPGKQGSRRHSARMENLTEPPAHVARGRFHVYRHFQLGNDIWLPPAQLKTHRPSSLTGSGRFVYLHPLYASEPLCGIGSRRITNQTLPFFDANFPNVRNHISDTSLIRSFSECPHRSLVSIKCRLYHFGSSGVIVGDAAHAMAPFYGQDMNAGMEDHAHATGAALRGEQGEDDENNNSSSRAAKIRGRALAEYSASRWRDAHAINDLAMQNYREMRTSQSTLDKLRKALEGFMHATFPSLGWQSKYSRVVFSNEPYAECVRRNDRQDRLLSIFTALCAGPFVAAGSYCARARGCSATALWSAVTAPWQWPCFRRHVLSVALGV